MRVMDTMHRMARDWRELTELTRGAPLVVERVSVAESGIAIEGAFALPRLAQLTMEDQIFVAAFVRAHGSIKEMEQVFGVSYPTIKTRLNRLAALLDFIETTTAPPAADARADVMDRLERGEMTPDDAISALEALTVETPR
jgi:hypothetical protein